MNRAAMLQEVRMDLKRRWPPRQDALPPENGAILTELQPLTGCTPGGLGENENSRSFTTAGQVWSGG